MKSKFPIKENFFRVYFSECTRIKYQWETLKVGAWIKRYRREMEEDRENANWHKKAKLFCSSWKIDKKAIGDFSLIMYLINKCGPEKIDPKEYWKSYSKTTKNVEEWILEWNGLINLIKKERINEKPMSKPATKEIRFYGTDKSETLVIKTQFIIEKVMILLCNKEFNWQTKSTETPELRFKRTYNMKVFSWGILNYLNRFTQYNSGKSLISNKQGLIIYDLLYLGGFIIDSDMDNIDRAKYIRAYVKQGSILFQK